MLQYEHLNAIDDLEKKISNIYDKIKEINYLMSNTNEEDVKIFFSVNEEEISRRLYKSFFPYTHKDIRYYCEKYKSRTYSEVSHMVEIKNHDEVEIKFHGNLISLPEGTIFHVKLYTLLEELKNAYWIDIDNYTRSYLYKK